MKTRVQIAAEEATRDPIFLFQIREVICTDQSQLEYDSNLEGLIAPCHPVYDEDGEFRTLTDDELLDMGYATETWRTITVFLTREEGQAYGRRMTHRYGERQGKDWRVYCVPCEGELSKQLNKLERLKSYEDALLYIAENLEIEAEDMGCDAGNPDGGSCETCEHCQKLQGARYLRRLIDPTLTTREAEENRAVMAMFDNTETI